MTTEDFNKLPQGKLAQPKYDGYADKAYKILGMDLLEGLVELNEPGYQTKTKWYRYENVDIVVPRKATVEEILNSK